MKPPRGGDRRSHRRRVVRVIVNHGGALAGSEHVEAAANAAESAQCAGDGGERAAQAMRDTDRAQRIRDVHRPGNAQLDSSEVPVARIDVETRTDAGVRNVDRAQRGTPVQTERFDRGRELVPGQRSGERIVDADERVTVVGKFAEKLSERACQRGKLVVARKVIVFEVRDDRHHRFEQSEGAVRLVRLGNEPRRASFVGVALKRKIDAAENEARVDAACA